MALSWRAGFDGALDEGHEALSALSQHHDALMANLERAIGNNDNVGEARRKFLMEANELLIAIFDVPDYVDVIPQSSPADPFSVYTRRKMMASAFEAESTMPVDLARGAWLWYIRMFDDEHKRALGDSKTFESGEPRNVRVVFRPYLLLMITATLFDPATFTARVSLFGRYRVGVNVTRVP